VALQHHVERVEAQLDRVRASLAVLVMLLVANGCLSVAELLRG